MHTNLHVCILISFNTVSLFLSFFPSFSLFLALFDFWWSLKASEILQVAKFDGLLRSSTSDIRQLRAHEGRSLCQFFRSCIQIALLFEVIFAMLGHFFVVQRVACSVLFLSSTTMEASSTDANLFSLEARSTFTRHRTAGRTKALSILPSLKKKSGRKGVPDAFPARLKEGRNTFPALF